MHLEEKINFLNHKINSYNKEKLELQSILEKNQNKRTIELENEIKSYKTLAEGCIKSCAKLTEEIVQLKKEIGKYVNNQQSTKFLGVYKKK